MTPPDLIFIVGMSALFLFCFIAGIKLGRREERERQRLISLQPPRGQFTRPCGKGGAK